MRIKRKLIKTNDRERMQCMNFKTYRCEIGSTFLTKKIIDMYNVRTSTGIALTTKQGVNLSQATLGILPSVIHFALYIYIPLDL